MFTEVFVDAAGGVVLLYSADKLGLNNLRRAYSTDGGESFAFQHGNVLGDDTAGGGGNSYVDRATVLLPDGRRRLHALKGGQAIHSFNRMCVDAHMENGASGLKAIIVSALSVN